MAKEMKKKVRLLSHYSIIWKFNFVIKLHILFISFPGTKSWYYAPYRCKYHIYEFPDVKECLEHLNIRHMHFNGDSMSRYVCSQVSQVS